MREDRSVLLQEITNKTLSDVENLDIVFPHDFAKAFYANSKKYGIDIERRNLFFVDLGAEMISGAISGANKVSKSANNAVDAIGKQDISELEIIKQELISTKVEMEELKIKALELEELRQKVYLDGLTLIYNRTWLSEFAIDSNGCVVSDGIFSFIDMSDFKQVNDRYGHLGGDNALAFIAAELKRSFSHMEGSSVVRYGGDEFFVFTPGVYGINSVNATLGKLKNALLNRPIYVRDGGGESFHIDFAFGTCEVKRGNLFSKALEEVDQIMYQNKINDKLFGQQPEKATVDINIKH